MNNKKILVFNGYYIPGYKAGGPIRTLANMVERLGEFFSFKVVTRDRDSGDREPYAGISKSSWNKVGQAHVRYVDLTYSSFSELQQIIQESNPDIIYLNSFFDSTFTQKVLLLRKLGRLPNVPIILAPRGEFSEGALAIKKNKKKAYIFLARLTGFYKNITWHASSVLEKKDIQKVFHGVQHKNIHIALNLAPKFNKNSLNQEKTKEIDKLKVVFLSRISPMKNLDYALRVLSKVRKQIDFTIYGPKGDPTYWDECKKLLTNLPENISVNWQGVVVHQDINKTLSEHHLFFLPTRGENYGHVINEALSAGLPVLISDQTPWEGLESAGAGWALPLDSPEVFIQQIEMVAKWDSAELTAASQAALDYAANMASNEAVVEANRQLFIKHLN